MNNKKIFLILTIACVFLLGIPGLNYYSQLSQGDHGRDLYAAQEILRGKLPYKDFWWVYGPAMPYYFAFFYKFFGGSIVSFLLGNLVLKTICGAFFFLAASVVMAPSIAFLAAMWFTQSQQEFFFTFNHIGGIAMEMWIIYCLLAYIKSRLPSTKNPISNANKYLWYSLPAIFIYCLIKINFGLAALATVLGVVGLTDFVYKNPLDHAKKKFYLSLAILLPLGVAFIYWLFLKDLTLYEVRQCMPYFGDDQPHHYPPSVTIPYYFTQHWLTLTHSPVGMLLGIILHTATMMTIIFMLQGRIALEKQRNLLLSLAALGLFFILNFHEFIVSGVWYRTYWSLPFLFLFHFIMMTTAFSFIPTLLRRFIWAIFGALLLLGFVAFIFSTQQQKIPPRLLTSKHANVYVGNELPWTTTVNSIAAYLNTNLKEDETFFALPYDCIYYYLTAKESPTRQLIFFDHMKITTEQEMRIIEELASKKTAFILMSNRIASSETGMGIFGKTYCPLISQYIAANYAPVAREGGKWDAEPGWGNNHGVMIFKKKNHK